MRCVARAENTQAAAPEQARKMLSGMNMKAPLTELNRYRHVGLLLLRLGMGAIFIVHGVTKFLGGSEVLATVGSVASVVGINSGHVFFGAVAATLEALGGLLLMLGLFTRLAAIAIGLVLLGAFVAHAANGDALDVWLHPLKAFTVMVALVFTGPGRYSLDAYMTDREALERSEPGSDVVRGRREPAWATREGAAETGRREASRV